MGISILLSQLLVGATLTLSPISATYHFEHLGEKTPYHIVNNDLTYHAQLSALYTTEHMQYAAFFMKDTFDHPAGGLVLGPKVDIWKNYISIGAVTGLYFRQSFPVNKFPMSYKIGKIEAVPLVMGTFNIAIPISKRLDLNIATEVAPILVHTDLGLRIHF
jgi:hypothetical protein